MKIPQVRDCGEFRHMLRDCGMVPAHSALALEKFMNMKSHKFHEKKNFFLPLDFRHCFMLAHSEY